MVDDFQMTMDLAKEKAAVWEIYNEVLANPSANPIKLDDGLSILSNPEEPALIRRKLLKFADHRDELCAANSQSLEELGERFQGEEISDEVFTETRRWESTYPPSAWDLPHDLKYVDLI